MGKNNPTREALEAEIQRLEKINKALMERVERSVAQGENAFAVFESNILLANQVRERTQDLENITQQLKREKNKLSRVIGALPGRIVIFDEDFNILEFFNDDTPQSHLGSQNNFRRVHWPIFKKELRNSVHSLGSKNRVINFDQWIDEDDGAKFYQCSVTQISSNQYIFYIQDNTEKMQQDKLIQAQRAQIVQASKLSALGEMAGGIAHEINTPLGTISLLASQMKRLLEKGSVDSERLLKNVEKVLHTVQRISTIVRSLRQISRDGSEDEMKPCSIDDILSDTMDLCEERFKSRGVKLEVERPPSLNVMAKRVQISQVLLNLLNNSFHIAQRCDDGWIRVTCEDVGKSVRIRVIDCGQGISDDILGKIFEPFFTTKDIGEGTGLGMSISRNIVREHRSDIIYECFEGHTSFHFELEKTADELSLAA